MLTSLVELLFYVEIIMNLFKKNWPEAGESNCTRRLSTVDLLVLTTAPFYVEIIINFLTKRAMARSREV